MWCAGGWYKRRRRICGWMCHSYSIRNIYAAVHTEQLNGKYSKLEVLKHVSMKFCIQYRYNEPLTAPSLCPTLISLFMLTCICLRRTLCARFSGERRTVTSSHPQLICLSCIAWHWKKLLDEQWSRNLDYERWYLYRCSLYAPCGIFADYEFRFVLQLSQTVAQYNSTTAFCNLWWHSCAVIFVGNKNKIH